MTTRRFWMFSGILALALTLALGFVLLGGDGAGQPLRATFAYLPEGKSGFPQVALTFDRTSLPQTDAAETAFELQPGVPGDFSWDGPTLLFTPATRLSPDTLYTARLRGGLRLVGGARLTYDSTTWQFRTGAGRLAFLRREGRAVNLWLSESGSVAPRPLTFETDRQVLSFTVSPGGQRLVYSLQEQNGREISLWLLPLPPVSGSGAVERPGPVKLVSEAGIQASAPRWSPGGDLIAYERRVVFESGTYSPAQLWLLRADGTSLPPLYAGAERVGVSLAWGAGGDQAVFWEPRRESLGLFSFNGDPLWQPLPHLKLLGLALSPDGREVLISRYDYSGAIEGQVLELLPLSKNGSAVGPGGTNTLPFPTRPGYNDRQPAWSADGKQFAFVRQGQTQADRTARLWLFEVASGRAKPLFESGPGTDPAYNAGAVGWSPDGQTLVFERYPASSRPGGTDSTLWVASRDGQNLRRLVENGFAARWL